MKWGPQSSDEMGALWLEVLPRRDEDVAGADARLRRALAARRHRRRGDAGRHQSRRRRWRTISWPRSICRPGASPDAVTQLEEALRLKPDDAEAHSNLASALQLQGRLADAMQHAREAARLKPDDDRVHFNLGNALSATGNVDEAIREFAARGRSSIRRTPTRTSIWRCSLGPRNRIDEAIAHLRRGASRSTRGMPTRTATWPSPSGSRAGLTRRSSKRARR